MQESELVGDPSEAGDVDWVNRYCFHEDEGRFRRTKGAQKTLELCEERGIDVVYRNLWSR